MVLPLSICGVCLKKNDMNQFTAGNRCAHPFHQTCIVSHTKARHACPYCSEPIDQLFVISRPYGRPKTRHCMRIDQAQDQFDQKSASQDRDKNCSICLEKLNAKHTKGACNHKFHHACLVSYTKIRSSCPTCNRRIRNLKMCTGPKNNVVEKTCRVAEEQFKHEQNLERKISRCPPPFHMTLRSETKALLLARGAYQRPS